MTDCFQPCELQHRITYEVIREMNRCGIGYLIVTKSDLIGKTEYLDIMDGQLAHIQISVTCLDDQVASKYEHAATPAKRVDTVLKLQLLGFDVSLRISPLIEEFMNIKHLNELDINKCVIEFLRVNTWIRKWLRGVDYKRYTVRQNNYWHLPLEEKIRLVSMIRIPEKTVCDDVSEHYQYWREAINPNKNDCCNLAISNY